jgi:hypothetical protein
MDKKIIEAIKKAFTADAGLDFVYISNGKVETDEKKCAGSEYQIIGRYQLEILDSLIVTEK